MNKNRDGFSTVALLLILVVAAIVGGIGWYVMQSRNEKPGSQTGANSQTTSTPETYNGSKEQDIANYDVASSSLKTALVNAFYDDAKKNCDQQNAVLAAEQKIKFVMSVGKMVRDDFATVGFCGSGATRVLAQVNGEWKEVTPLDMAPACSVVDQYKISKEVTSTCLDTNNQAQNVTYP